ncbi:polyisoprenoid-binding protein [Paenibacillus sp. 1011MAR3C5]|uniref:YceI family protein n=1 Tax=Paenibacillus sp. 1011MAR3C5 TaxID=1675787 RepID=UPI000E6D2514|nr:YceI family protein [Paenibacillus sp. 1011MAR3C5]RJE86061.1 polyisoprenoid-binding protein [Paenibacillus sp. 1011MAR3C5]
MTKAQWVVDASHSEVGFSVRHLMIAKVKGTFHAFDANIVADPADLTSAEISFNIDLSSVDTRNGDRDAHLKSADFFDVEKFPTLGFKATSISQTSEGEYTVTGDVSLHGVTRSESFEVTFEGTSRDPWGNTKAGFSATGAIKRSDYGLTYNAALETGGVMIGDEVKITLEIEALQQA